MTPSSTKPNSIERRINEAQEPFRTMILAQLDEMSPVERESTLALLGAGVDAFESGDRERFNLVMQKAGYGEYAAIVWEQLKLWLQ